MPDHVSNMPYAAAAPVFRLRDVWSASASPATRRATGRLLMDIERVSYDEYRQAQHALQFLNAVTCIHRPVMAWLENMRICNIRAVLDAGNCNGDLLFKLACAGVAPLLIGADSNPWTQRTLDSSRDLFPYGPADGIDIVISSHFAHTLDDRELVSFLQWIEATAQKGWMICERRRHPLLHFVVKWSTRIFSKNRLIRHDAPLSVARGFTAHDWGILLDRAGIPREQVNVRRAFPFRYVLTREKV